MKRIIISVTVFTTFLSIIYSQNPVKTFIEIGESIVMDSILYFNANDGINGSELWRTDGTTDGTFIVKDLEDNYWGSNPSHLTIFKGELYFSASTSIYSSELWKSDGTAEGTVLVKDLSESGGSNPADLTATENYLYFTATEGDYYSDLYKTDGTAEGTIKVKEFGGFQFSRFTPIQDNMFLKRFGGPNSLWKLDLGTDSMTEIIIDKYYTIDKLNNFNNNLYFITNINSGRGIRLWRYIIENDSLILIKELSEPQYELDNIDNFCNVNGVVYFSIRIDFDNNTDELWKTDGSPEGTCLIKTFSWDSYSSASFIGNFISFNNLLFFRGKSSNSYKLWISDGTEIGTKQLADVTLQNEPGQMAISNSYLYFCGGQSYNDFKLWETDGSTEGTRISPELNKTEISMPDNLIDADGILYFTTDNENGITLWNNRLNPEINLYSGNKSLKTDDLLNFDLIPVDSHAIKKILIKNEGEKELIISGIQITGRDFYFSFNNPNLILPGNIDTLSVHFFPSRQGKVDGIIEILNNDNNESDYVLKLSGEGSSLSSNKNIYSDDIFNLEQKSNFTVTGEISLSNNEFPENCPKKYYIGKFSIPDHTGKISYTFTNGIGDADNSNFFISNDSLFTNKSFDYESTTTSSVRVAAFNNNDTVAEDLLILKVKNLNEIVETAACGYTLKSLSFNLNSVEFADENVVFAFGENGIIIKSHDSGKTWKELNSGISINLVHSQFLNEIIGYVSGHNKLYKTENSGETWVPLEISSSTGISDFYFISPDTGVVIGEKIFYTYDGGKQWKFVDNPLVYASSVFMLKDSIAFACGNTSLAKTTDLSNSWTIINLSNLEIEGTLSDIFFTRNGTGYIITTKGDVLKSTDMGNTWNKTAGINKDNLKSIYFVDNETGYAFSRNDNSDYYITKDGGMSWSYGGFGYFNDIAFNKSGTNGVLVGLTNSYWSNEPGRAILYTDDSGNTWDSACFLLGNINFMDVSFANDTIGYIVGSGLVQKTTDAGITWEEIYPKILIPFGISGCSFINKDTGYIASYDSIFRTCDGGYSWKGIPGPLVAGIGYIKFLSYDHGFISYANELYKTKNGGLSWTPVLDFNGFGLRDILFDDNNAYIVGYHYAYHSNDYGDTWSIINGINMEQLFRSVYFINTDTGFIGGEDGILYKTSDAGKSWKKIKTGIPIAITHICFTNSENGIALAYNDGGISEIYETNDCGETWDFYKQLTCEFTNIDITNNGTVFITGSEGQLYKYEKERISAESGYIIGDTLVCKGTRLRYTVQDNGYNYKWEVTGNNPFYNNLNFNSIDWLFAGDYTVKVTPYNSCGNGIPREIIVHVDTISDPNISGLEIVNEYERNVLYQCDSENGMNWLWQVEGGTITSAGNDYIRVNWITKDDGKVYVIKTSDNSFCRTASSKLVTIIPSENKEGSKVYIALNPVNYNLRVTVISLFNGDVIFNLYDVTGKIRKSFKLNKSTEYFENDLDISNLDRGIYILQVIQKTTVLNKIKIIKE